MLEQLPLEFKLLDNVNFSNFFFSESNQQLYFALKNFLMLDNNSELFFYLCGNKQAGKTHLLQACCSKLSEKNIQAMYISINNLLNINYLDGLESLSLICLDDIHHINNILLEEKIFYLFNSLRAKKHKLIVAADCTPSNLSLKLPDLKSRMSWGITYYVHGLTDQEKILALMMRAEQVGLELNEAVANYLLTRVSRSTEKLFKILETLDHASLAAKRRLTIPFVKEVLKI